MITGILCIIFWLGVIPLCVGFLFSTWLSEKENLFLKSYLYGLILCFALFQGLTIFNMFTVNDFFKVCTQYSVSLVGLAVLGVLLFVIAVAKGRLKIPEKNAQADTKKNKNIAMECIVLTVIFGVVVAFQLIQTLRLTYPDGDDAYYVGVATYGASVPQMYSKIPYTGAYTGFDSRHCLAPFPYMIAFLSRMSQISSVTIAHSILPVCFILFMYGIHYLICTQLCKEKRERILYMLLISVLLMFGNYSVYSMETFLMTRIRQGKASLGSFALPLGFYFLLMLGKNLEGKRKDRVIYYLLLGCNGLTAALFTTMGNFIYPSMVMLGGLCICFGKKEWKKLFPLALTCLPSVVMGMIYLIIR